MFITDFEIKKQGDLVGILHFDQNGFSLPNDSKLLEHVRMLNFKGHKFIFNGNGDTAFVKVVPPDLTKNTLLRRIQVLLRYTGFVLEAKE